jgi:hypothetical protein
LARIFLLGHVCAGAGLLAEAQRNATADDTGPAPSHLVATAVAASGHVVFLQAVALGGLARYLRGDRQTKWSTPAR